MAKRGGGGILDPLTILLMILLAPFAIIKGILAGTGYKRRR